jgi:uncharacterized membrane protein
MVSNITWNEVAVWSWITVTAILASVAMFATLFGLLAVAPQYPASCAMFVASVGTGAVFTATLLASFRLAKFLGIADL